MLMYTMPRDMREVARDRLPDIRRQEEEVERKMLEVGSSFHTNSSNFTIRQDVKRQGSSIIGWRQETNKIG